MTRIGLSQSRISGENSMTAPVLTSKLDREAPDAKARFAHNQTLATDLRSAVAETALGGPERSRERHVSRGKLLDIGAGTNEIRRMVIGRELIGAAG